MCVCVCVRVCVCVYVYSVLYTAEFGEGLINEDEGDEEGEDLLGEAGDKAHQEAALDCHNQHDNDDEPHADPHSTYDVLNVLRLTELGKTC